MKNEYDQHKSLEKTDPKVVEFVKANASVENMPTIDLKIGRASCRERV